MSGDFSDAFVFFGASGALAYKQIFPALQALIKDGHLTIPVIGVAKSIMPPYERLLGDAIKGDASLFAREDSVEAAWRVLDQILDIATLSSSTTNKPGDRKKLMQR